MLYDDANNGLVFMAAAVQVTSEHKRKLALHGSKILARPDMNTIWAQALNENYRMSLR